MVKRSSILNLSTRGLQTHMTTSESGMGLWGIFFQEKLVM